MKKRGVIPSNKALNAARAARERELQRVKSMQFLPREFRHMVDTIDTLAPHDEGVADLKHLYFWPGWISHKHEHMLAGTEEEIVVIIKQCKRCYCHDCTNDEDQPSEEHARHARLNGLRMEVMEANGLTPGPETEIKLDAILKGDS